MNPSRLKAYSLLIIVAVIFGVAGLVIKLTLNAFPADIFLLYRFFLSSIAALVIFFVTGIKLPKSLGSIFLIILYAILTSTLSLGFLFLGTEKTSLLDMSLISIVGPLITILGGYLFLKEHVTNQEKFGISISFVGSILIIVEPIFNLRSIENGALIGNLLIIFSLIATALSSILLKKLLRTGVAPLTLTNISFIVGFLTLIPFVFLKYNPNQVIEIFKNASPLYHLGVIYMALISGTLAYTLGNIAQKTIEVSEAALFSYVYPIFSAILAVIVLGDKLTPLAITGSVITFVGVFLAEIKKRQYN